MNTRASNQHQHRSATTALRILSCPSLSFQLQVSPAQCQPRGCAGGRGHVHLGLYRAHLCLYSFRLHAQCQLTRMCWWSLICTVRILSCPSLSFQLQVSPAQCQLTRVCRWPWGRYHGGRRLSSEDSFHSPTTIPSSALDKPRIMKVTIFGERRGEV